MKKWMNIAGYFTIISFILILISGAVTIFDVSGLRIYDHLFGIIISFFLFLGFLTLGKFSKNKSLIVVSWIILFVSIIISVYSIAYLINPYILIFLATKYSISFSLNTILVVLLPSGIRSILDIFLGISLMKIKKVKFAKTTGILSIIIGVFYSIFLPHLGSNYFIC